MSAALSRTTDDGAQAPDLASIVRAAQDRLRHAVHVGQLRDDPLSAALEAIGVSLDAQLRLHDANAGQMRALREPLDPAALQRLETAAASGAAKRAAELARASNLRTLLLAGTITVIAVFAAGAGGFWWGQHAQGAAIAATETGVAAAFRDGPAAAATWLGFMQANDGDLVREACAKSTVKTADGRRACAVALWVDLLPNPLPRTQPARP